MAFLEFWQCDPETMSAYIGIPTTFATLAAPLAIKVAISGEASDKHFVKWREIRFSESGIGCQVNSSSRRSSNMAALEMSAHVTSCKATRWMTFQCSRCSSNGAFIHDTVLPSNLVKSRSCEIKVNTVIIALKNLPSVWAAQLSWRLPNFKAIWQFKYPISRPRDVARFYDNMYVCLVNKGPAFLCGLLSFQCSLFIRPWWAVGGSM